MPGTLYSLAALLVAMLTVSGVLARGVARDTATKAWRETAEALETRVDELLVEVTALKRQSTQLKAQAGRDTQLIKRLTQQRDTLRTTVNKLTARVTDLERRLTQAGIVVEADPLTEATASP